MANKNSQGMVAANSIMSYLPRSTYFKKSIITLQQYTYYLLAKRDRSIATLAPQYAFNIYKKTRKKETFPHSGANVCVLTDLEPSS